MSNADKRKGTSDAFAAAKLSLQTARMSLGEFERLREVMRGPAPAIEVLIGLVGRGFDDVEVQPVLSPFNLRHRTLMSGQSEAVGKGSGLRVLLDSKRRIELIAMSGEANHRGASAWSGAVGPGLTTASTYVDVRRVLGRGTIVDVDGVREEHFNSETWRRARYLNNNDVSTAERSKIPVLRAGVEQSERFDRAAFESIKVGVVVAFVCVDEAIADIRLRRSP